MERIRLDTRKWAKRMMGKTFCHEDGRWVIIDGYCKRGRNFWALYHYLPHVHMHKSHKYVTMDVALDWYNDSCQNAYRSGNYDGEICQYNPVLKNPNRSPFRSSGVIKETDLAGCLDYMDYQWESL